MENRINSYVPDLNLSFDELQQQLTAFIQAEREHLKTCILKGESGLATCTQHTLMWDTVLQKVYNVAQYQIQTEFANQIEELAKLGDSEIAELLSDLTGPWTPDIALYAVGSYGRQELCYYSDLDVVYTSAVDLEEVYDERTLELIRWFYDFFDSLHSVIPVLNSVSSTGR